MEGLGEFSDLTLVFTLHLFGLAFQNFVGVVYLLNLEECFLILKLGVVTAYRTAFLAH